MFKPDDFLVNFAKHKDFAKVSKFHVEIAKPANFGFGGLDFKELRFQCEAAELPGYNINTVDARIYGVPAPVASFASFNDITLTFICAGDLWEKKLFDYWVNYIVPINNYHLRYKNEYVSSKINITQFYETGEPSYIVSLFNAFPITLSPLTLNWGDDGIHKLSVTFKYDYWATVNTQNFSYSDNAPRTNSVAPTRPAQSVQPSTTTGAGANAFKPGSGKLTTGVQPILTIRPLGALPANPGQFGRGPTR